MAQHKSLVGPLQDDNNPPPPVLATRPRPSRSQAAFKTCFNVILVASAVVAFADAPVSAPAQPKLPSIQRSGFSFNTFSVPAAVPADTSTNLVTAPDRPRLYAAAKLQQSGPLPPIDVAIRTDEAAYITAPNYSPKLQRSGFSFNTLSVPAAAGPRTDEAAFTTSPHYSPKLQRSGFSFSVISVPMAAAARTDEATAIAAVTHYSPKLQRSQFASNVVGVDTDVSYSLVVNDRPRLGKPRPFSEISLSDTITPVVRTDEAQFISADHYQLLPQRQGPQSFFDLAARTDEAAFITATHYQPKSQRFEQPWFDFFVPAVARTDEAALVQASHYSPRLQRSGFSFNAILVPVAAGASTDEALFTAAVTHYSPKFQRSQFVSNAVGVDTDVSYNLLVNDRPRLLKSRQFAEVVLLDTITPVVVRTDEAQFISAQHYQPRLQHFQQSFFDLAARTDEAVVIAPSSPRLFKSPRFPQSFFDVFVQTFAPASIEMLVGYHPDRNRQFLAPRIPLPPGVFETIKTKLSSKIADEVRVGIVRSGYLDDNPSVGGQF